MNQNTSASDELPEVYEMRRALNALNLEVHHSIAKDVKDKVEAAINAQVTAVLERLESQSKSFWVDGSSPYNGKAQKAVPTEAIHAELERVKE